MYLLLMLLNMFKIPNRYCLGIICLPSLAFFLLTKVPPSFPRNESSFFREEGDFGVGDFGEEGDLGEDGEAIGSSYAVHLYGEKVTNLEMKIITILAYKILHRFTPNSGSGIPIIFPVRPDSMVPPLHKLQPSSDKCEMVKLREQVE